MELLSAQIKEFGYAVRMIPASDYLPSFAYTIGLWENYRHPEVIAFGLSTDTLHAVLNTVGEEIQAGKCFAVGQSYDEILQGYPVHFLAVDKRNIGDYFGQAMGYYKENFPAIELIWTDKNKKFPFEEGFDDALKHRQPLLDRNADFKFFEEKNLAVFTTTDWLTDKKPIVEVQHDNDGDWIFLTETKTEQDLKIVSLEQMILSDNSLNAVFDLDYGEKAVRKNQQSRWEISELTAEN